MESCLNYKPERVGSVTVEDLRKDLFAEFSKLSRESVALEKEHLQVYLRVRPFTVAEKADGESQECISIEPPDTVILKPPRASMTSRHSERLGPQLAQRFQFSHVYGPGTTQRQMFEGTTKSLVKDVLEGGNSLIFTYGVTNAGKTFTFLGPESDGGILPRSLNVIFNSIEGRIYSQNNIKPHRCVDVIRLTKDQQDEEATNKRNLLRRYKDSDSQKTLSSISSCSSLECSSSSDVDGNSVCLDEASNVKFSVWVSFCEIYNENIHDLLDLVPNGSHKRSVLRLAQDFKGNAFVKDLKWVQVNSADEVFKVVKIGRKNQSFSSTKLNNISSRSHSIFSIRILRIEDAGVPRVQTVSELSLCDLAGSERCAKTQNRGERLKEAGNINTSLLTLGKCINALRLNQTQSKFNQHIPFRESKLTHYLQGFFCGRGKACMIININQCASMYDETLNVLKFSAVAQKVVVLNPKPAPTVMAKRSARDVSMIINNADQKNWTRRSSLMGWEMSLEDVQEDEDDIDEDMSDEEVESDDDNMEEQTVLEAADSQELEELQMKIEELNEKLAKEESEKLTMESRIREEVTAEFMELFSNMEKDYNERLQREKEIVEERAERRLEILKSLVNRTIEEITADRSDENAANEAQIKLLDSVIETMRDGLTKIKGDAEAMQICLTNVPDETVIHLRSQIEDVTEQLQKSQQQLSLKTKELEAVCASNDQLQDAKINYENQKVRCQELMSICQEKDDMISKLQTALDDNVEAATKDRALIDTIKEEILQLKNNCKCTPNKDGTPGEEELKVQQLMQELKIKDEQLDELKLEQCALEKKVCDLSDKLAERTRANKVTVSSLLTERAEVTKVTNENKAIANELHVLQQTANEMSTKLTNTQFELNDQVKVSDELSEELDAAKALLKERQEESQNQTKTIESLMTELDRLRLELGANQSSRDETETLREKMLESIREKNQQIANLEQELSQTKGKIHQLEELSSQLRLELDTKIEEHKNLLSRYEAEKLNVDQIRSNSELLEQLKIMKQQQKQDSRDDCWRTLLETLNQSDEILNIASAIVERDLAKAREDSEQKMNEMEKSLAQKDAELKNKSQALLKSKELMNDGLNKMKSMSCDLQQLEKERSDVRDKLSEATAQVEQLQKQILSLNEENRSYRLREEMKDQALRRLSCKEQSIDPVQTARLNLFKETIQLSQTNCHELSAKQQQVEATCDDFNKEMLEDKPNEIESVPEDRLNAQEMHSIGVREPQQQNAKVSVLDASVLSTKSLRDERFPKPELEISFTPLKPNRINVRKPGEEESVTIKLRRSARKRKSPEMEKEMGSENRKTRRLRVNKENIQSIETPKTAKELDSPASLKGKKDGALQKIGDFIQSSLTLNSSAMKIINMVKSPEPLNASENTRPKRSKRKLFKTHVSSPMDIPCHPIGGGEDDKESDHLIIKRKLRTRTAKR